MVAPTVVPQIVDHLMYQNVLYNQILLVLTVELRVKGHHHHSQVNSWHRLSSCRTIDPLLEKFPPPLLTIEASSSSVRRLLHALHSVMSVFSILLQVFTTEVLCAMVARQRPSLGLGGSAIPAPMLTYVLLVTTTTSTTFATTSIVSQFRVDQGERQPDCHKKVFISCSNQ